MRRLWFLPSSVSRRLAIAALALGVGLSIVVFAQRRPDPPAPRAIRGGNFEASGVVGVPGSDGVLIVDDGRPRHVLWMTLSAQGDQIGEVTEVSIHADVPDMEDITSDGDNFYVVGSQFQGSRDDDGLVRFRFHPRTLTTTHVERVAGLRDLLIAAVPQLQSGRRRGLPINIEGMTWDQGRSRLLLGLRSPLAGDQALVVPIRLRDAALPLSAANLVIDPAIQLPLNGAGIRALGYDDDRHTCLLIAGASSYGHPVDFQLYEWDGAAAASLRPIASFPAAQKPEGVTRITLGGRRRTVVVFDIGGYRLID